MLRRLLWTLVAACTCCWTGNAKPVRAAGGVDFSRDVRPLLADRCFACHGPDAEERAADLRLDRREGPDGSLRVIAPGSVEGSELWRRVTSRGDDAMPPADSTHPPLDAAELSIVRRWIEQGAPYADFWAFRPPQSPALPSAADLAWPGIPASDRPIDLLVRRRLADEGRAPAPRAEPRTLVRRLSLDVTGLPPTREEVAAYLADHALDADAAYERLVDRLLASPAYGEHMARYWLDLVRFADTNGLHHDHYREMSPYRDWVIRAFQENLPYDQFVAYQIAGDLAPDPSPDQLVASGFHRLHLIIDVGTALPEESYTRNVLDRVTAVGTAFLGLTVQCATCHDHKYDPLTTREFYQLFAFFNNLDAEPETGGRQGDDFRRGLQPPYVALPTAEQQAELVQSQQRIAEGRRRLEAASQRATDAPTQAAQEEAAAAQAALESLEADKKLLEDQISYAMVMRERPVPRPAFVLRRGAYDQPGEQVSRGVPAFLPPLPPTDGEPTRREFAAWLTSAEHPLTARVAVNRLWQQLMGVGLVSTPDDFGAQGAWPSHPELLDYLSVTFRTSGWDVKALVKQVVMSETYRQTSAAPPNAYREDPENRLLARGSRHRLDAEVIRDQILATSGLLNRQMYGKSVKPPQPAGLWETVSMPSSYPRTYEADQGDAIYRRSVYTFWKRALPPPQMTILNAPTRETCTARRERTNTPQQALLLLNEEQYLRAARRLAAEALAAPVKDDAARVAWAYETIVAEAPDERETTELLDLAVDLQRHYDERPRLAAQLCEGMKLAPGIEPSRLAAWTLVVSAIYNLDVVKTRS